MEHLYLVISILKPWVLAGPWALHSHADNGPKRGKLVAAEEQKKPGRWSVSIQTSDEQKLLGSRLRVQITLSIITCWFWVNVQITHLHGPPFIKPEEAFSRNLLFLYIYVLVAFPFLSWFQFFFFQINILQSSIVILGNLYFCVDYIFVLLILFSWWNFQIDNKLLQSN